MLKATVTMLHRLKHILKSWKVSIHVQHHYGKCLLNTLPNLTIKTDNLPNKQAVMATLKFPLHLLKTTELYKKQIKTLIKWKSSQNLDMICQSSAVTEEDWKGSSVPLTSLTEWNAVALWSTRDWHFQERSNWNVVAAQKQKGGKKVKYINSACGSSPCGIQTLQTSKIAFQNIKQYREGWTFPIHLEQGQWLLPRKNHWEPAGAREMS